MEQPMKRMLSWTVDDKPGRKTVARKGGDKNQGHTRSKTAEETEGAILLLRIGRVGEDKADISDIFL